VRWRRLDLKRVIAERFGVDFHPRYVGKSETSSEARGVAAVEVGTSPGETSGVRNP
jgi:hypothetical protein